MRFEMNINMNNAAFKVDSDQAAIAEEINLQEVQRILKKVVDSLGDYVHGDTIKDINGNTVGSWDISADINDPEYLDM